MLRLVLEERWRAGGACLRPNVCMYVCISHKTARVVKSCPPCTLFQLIANRHNFTIVIVKTIMFEKEMLKKYEFGGPLKGQNVS